MKARIEKIALINFFYIFTFFGFGTVELYISNPSEFWFTAKDIFPTIILIAIIAFLILTILVFFLPQHIYEYVLVLIWGITIALYIQGNFLPNDYGALNGVEILWENYHLRAITNSIIWIFVLCLSVFLFKKFKNHFMRLIFVSSGIILATQVSSLVILKLTTPPPEKSQAILTEEHILEVSSQNNIIVFLLDAFDAELFTEILDEASPEWKAQFNDFVYYPDTVGGATRTKYAIPYILTGQPYTTQDSYIKYLQKSYANSPLLNKLNEQSYDTRLFTAENYIDTSQATLIDNLAVSIPTPTSTWGLTKDFLKLTAFRYMPHSLKKYFWMYSGDFSIWKGSSEQLIPYVTNDSALYHKLITQKINVSNIKGCFRFYHLDGAHPPFTMNENCEQVEIGNSSETQQALGALKIVTEFIDQLKSENAYNNSTIVLMADHGVRGLEQNPLFVIKPQMSSCQFEVSNFPLSYADLQKIFISALEKSTALPEDYILPREERYFYVGSGGGNNRIDIVEYVSADIANNTDAFHETGNIFHGDTLTSNTLQKYKLGQKLSFMTEATANKYCTNGFSVNEGDLTWTLGERSNMEFLLDGKYSNLSLQLECGAFLAPQRLRILANDKLIAEEIVSNHTIITASIPGDYIQNKKLSLEFQHPDAISPADAGKSVDERVLGMSMRQMSISAIDEIEEFAYRNVFQDKLSLNFSATGNNADYTLNGWWDQEKESRWTSDNASLYIAIQDESPISMKIDGKVLTEGPFEVWANRKKVSEGIWKKEDVQQIIEIPAEFIDANSYLIIGLKFPNATSPKELGFSKDSRTLGVFVNEITFEKQFK